MNDKKLYNRCKLISNIYNIPLYISWRYRYNINDIKYIKKYGYSKK